MVKIIKFIRIFESVYGFWEVSVHQIYGCNSTYAEELLNSPIQVIFITIQCMLIVLPLQQWDFTDHACQKVKQFLGIVTYYSMLIPNFQHSLFIKISSSEASYSWKGNCKFQGITPLNSRPSTNSATVHQPGYQECSVISILEY